MALDVLQTKLTPEQAAGWKISHTGELLAADEITPPPPLGYLYAYLLATRLIEPLRPSEANIRTESVSPAGRLLGGSDKLLNRGK